MAFLALDAQATLKPPTRRSLVTRHEHPHGDQSDRYASHRDALAVAGFGEIGTVWQRADDRVLVAVR